MQIGIMDDKALFTVLKGAEKTDGQVGRSGMLKILLGRDSKKLSKLKLDHLDQFGSLSYMGKNAVLEHIDDLIERGCLHVSSFFFSMVELTDVGKARMRSMVQSHGLRILPDRPVSPQTEGAHVYNEREFWDAFLLDLQYARSEVVIVSPFISVWRTEMLMKVFEQLSDSGVSIQIHVRPVKGSSQARAILKRLRAMGIKVVLRAGIHYKAAIIDKVIAWEGSLNILQHWGTGEQMTRHEDSEYIGQLLAVLEIKTKVV